MYDAEHDNGIVISGETGYVARHARPAETGGGGADDSSDAWVWE